jgi:hypothetical protein
VVLMRGAAAMRRTSLLRAVQLTSIQLVTYSVGLADEPAMTGVQ